MLLVALAPKHRQWISVSLSASGLIALGTATAVTRLDYGLGIWPWGPILWFSLAGLVFILKIGSRKELASKDFDRKSSIAFLALTLIPVACLLMLLFIRHGVPEYFDDAVLFGALTIGLTQLGFAGILEKNLVGSALGRSGWTLATVIGSAAFLGSWFVAVAYLVFVPSF